MSTLSDYVRPSVKGNCHLVSFTFGVLLLSDSQTSYSESLPLVTTTTASIRFLLGVLPISSLPSPQRRIGLLEQFQPPTLTDKDGPPFFTKLQLLMLGILGDYVSESSQFLVNLLLHKYYALRS